MAEALVLTFQSQLSIIMETILKSAMTEITRLVEDSFMEEVARGKQEVELLLRRLQFSESTLKERDRRARCSDCGRTASAGERTAEKPAEMLAGEDSLCFRLSLREQSEKRPPFSDVWSSTEALDSHIPTSVQCLKEKNVMDAGEKNRKQQNMSTNMVQLPQRVLQNLRPNEAVTRTHESCNKLKSREGQCKTPVRDFTPSTETDLAQSRLIQSVPGEVDVCELAPSPPNGSVKPERGPDPDLAAIKEEEEMLPVWDCRGDDADGDTDPNHAGSWNRDESQVDNFPNLTALDMPDPSSRLMSYSVDCNSEISQRIKAEHVESVDADLVRLALAPGPDRAGSLNENGHLFERCPGENLFLTVPLPNAFPQSEPLPVCEKSFTQLGQTKAHVLPLQKPLSCAQRNETFVHATELKEHQQQQQHLKDRPHVCSTCGKAFTRYGNFKQHQNIHTHEKLFNCTHCGMRFKRSTHLRIHLRRHSRVGKSCSCRQCGKTFVCLRQLKGHLLKVHGTEMN